MRRHHRRASARRALLGTVGLLVSLPGALADTNGEEVIESPPAVPLPAALDTIDANVAALVRERHAVARQQAPAPARAGALAELAIAYEANDLWALATSTWGQALSLREVAVWRFHYALSLRASGRLEEATQVLRDLVRADSTQPWTQERLGEALFEQGELERAATAYARVIELQADAPFGHAGLGQVRLAQGDHDGAVAALERAVSLAPGYRQARYMLGLAYRAQGRRDLAARELQRGVDAVRSYLDDPLTQAVRAATVNVPARRNLANSMLAQRRPDQAAALLEQIVASASADTSDINNLAVAYLQLNRLDDAQAILTDIESRVPDHFGTQLNLVSLAMRRGQVEVARRHAERAVAIAPRVARTHQTLARVQARTGDWEGAATSLANAEQLDARDPLLAAMHGDVLARLGQDTAAAERYAHALSLYPDLLPAQLSLARVRLRLGDVAGARALHTRAAQLAPDHPAVAALAEALQAQEAQR